jgi:nitronate monooxygenase
VLNNAAVEHILEIERLKGDALEIGDIYEQVAGVYPRVMNEGEVDAGAWSCGMVAGLIRDVPSVKELIDRTIGEARSILARRLAPMLEAALPA